MATDVAASHAPNRLWITVGVLLLVVGLSGHLLAARAIGGYYIAYRDHIMGFFILTAAGAVIIWLVSLRFWRRRYDLSLLILGALQAIIGFIIYLNRFNIG